MSISRQYSVLDYTRSYPQADRRWALPRRFCPPCWDSVVGRERVGLTLSSIMYASSYCVTNRRHSNKRSCPHYGASDDEIFDFSRWFVVQPADENTSLNSLSAFALGKALKAQIGTLLTVRRLQCGDILIETDNPTYASMLGFTIPSSMAMDPDDLATILSLGLYPLVSPGR